MQLHKPFKRLFLILENKQQLAGLAAHGHFQADSGLVGQLAGTLNDQRSAAQLAHNGRYILLIQRLRTDLRQLACADMTTLLDRFYQIDRQHGLAGTRLAHDHNVTNIRCAAADIALLIFQRHPQLIAHAVHRSKIGKQLLLILCQFAVSACLPSFFSPLYPANPLFADPAVQGSIIRICQHQAVTGQRVHNPGFQIVGCIFVLI